MDYLLQFFIIMIFSFLGEALAAAIPLPIPAAIYGLVLLFIALCLGIVKLEKIEKVGGFLTGILALLFIPPAVNLITCWNTVRPIVSPAVVIIIVSTVLVFAVSGRVTQFLVRRKEDHRD